MNRTAFPRPIKIANGTTRWPLSAVVRYESALAGTLAPSIPPESERFLSVRDLSERLHVTRSTIWRWVEESRPRDVAA